ncbi:hypothetical protein [Agromyces sp. Root1464]|uniref:hypothetical protein n=1 Tax=Agromyces sp. Root1464 TaxID=1736467 RepID=UPI00138ECF8F|nr:hypothetical protein [Agromyces sp. Root1464]
MIDLQDPTFTRRVELEHLAEFGISHLFFGADIEEERASIMASAFPAGSPTVACRVEELDEAVCLFHAYDERVNLFEASQLDDLLSGLTGTLAVDLTSLENRVWAPLVRALVRHSADFLALYAEPDDYRKGDLPGFVYDLSVGRGIEPLPGFAQVSRRSNDEGHFAPLLGFEGARLSHIIDQEEVEIARSYPVVGSPGFRVEYPTTTYVANQSVLELEHMDQRVEFAQASCPFEAYRALARIHSRIGDQHLRIAPIGTKPHALGAILYAIEHPAGTEIVYDHPERSRGRTRGTRGVYVYEVSGFLADLSSHAAR